MHALIDFFNHGLLPYIGRSAELDRLFEFWRGTTESQELRGALVLGEAGAGKSRLVEEVTPKIVSAGGVVVHVKLFPGGTTSIAPLISHALWFSAAGRQLLKKEPEGTMVSVTMALGRLARLRPTMLVIEDIHLLSGESLGEFASLLEGLSDQTISVLSLARPVELKARGVIERYLVEEIRLDALGEQDLLSLWQGLFGTSPDHEIVQGLLRTTRGNALALRSALRGLLKSDALAHDPLTDSWRVAISGSSLAEALERNVRFLSEGMAAYLSDEEKHLAEELASLGEVFSREAAGTILDDAERAIEVLTFKGIVAISAPITPLPGPGSAHSPLAFTHTLLHKHLTEHASPHIERIIRVIGSGLPLYSVLPFQLLAGKEEVPEILLEEIYRAIDRSLSIAYSLDKSSDWEMARPVLKAAEVLAETCREHQTEEERRQLRIRLLDCRLTLLHREDHTEEFRSLLNELLDLTDDDLAESMLTHRISALRYLFRRERKRDIAICRGAWDEVEDLVERFPSLRSSYSFMLFLQTSALFTNTESDSEMTLRAERHFTSVLDSGQISEELRRFAMQEVAPQFLGTFSTAEQLNERMTLLAEIEAYSGEDDLTVKTRKLAFLEGLGHADEAVRLADDIIPRLRDRGLTRHIVQCSIIRLSALAWFGSSLEEIEAQAERLQGNAPEDIREALRLRLGLRLAKTGVLRNDPVWTRHIIDRFLDDERKLDARERVILAAGEGHLTSTLAEIQQTPQDDPLDLLTPLLLGNEDAEVAEEAIREILHSPILTRDSILEIYLTLDLIEALAADRKHVKLVADAGPGIHQAIVAMLEWLAERSLFGGMTPILKKYGKHLATKELASWQTRTGKIAERHRIREAVEQADHRMRISMLGTIEARYPNGEVHQLRGVRLRTLLGLMVVDQMLDRPFSYREFCRFAASGEEDQERARKMMNMGVLRLREAIGTDAILTSAETPRLNPAYVRVDLLEANRRLREGAQAAREGALVRAVAPLVEALDLTCGQVPFPGLYDDFFEAAREDFEFGLRSAIIDVSQGLLREGDAASAEQVLRRGFDAMPDDEEIAELLRETLIELGKRIEAERVRVRAAEALQE
jgi:hypothetical protein